MNPFVYPKSKHLRRLKPPQYVDYRSYKQHLRIEFSKQCVYCRMPEGRMPDRFGADHYRPEKRFPHLVCVYENLFYCCNACNSAKGAWWPSAADKKVKRFLPNPCDYVMFQHVRYSGPRIEGRTVAGEWLVELLGLDDPTSETIRAAMLGTIETIEKALATAAATEAGLTALLQRCAPGSPQIAPLQAAIHAAQAEQQKQKLCLTLYS